MIDFSDAADAKQQGKGENATDPISKFSKTVSLLVSAASPYDEVVVRLTSPGGAVTTYGLAAAQLLRLRKAGIKVTACVDTVAASGGYMMACVADKIVASPFSFLGSVGVVSGMPNFSKVMEKNDVEYMMFTAGKYKRTVHPLVKPEKEDKEKFQEQLDQIHDAFKDHVEAGRKGHIGDFDEVGTGEAWLAQVAAEKGLVDQLATSDEYIRSKMANYDVIQVEVAKKRRNKLQDLLEKGVHSIEASDPPSPSPPPHPLRFLVTREDKLPLPLYADVHYFDDSLL